MENSQERDVSKEGNYVENIVNSNNRVKVNVEIANTEEKRN
jgi:hypothetical protein